MPYSRPGREVYVTNESGGVILHGAPVLEASQVGVAVKQKATHWSDGLVAQNQIADEEQYLLISTGIVMVDTTISSGTALASSADGDPVWITTANVLAVTNAGSGTLKFGRIVEIVGDGRGVPTGRVRINLDQKDSF